MVKELLISIRIIPGQLIETQERLSMIDRRKIVLLNPPLINDLLLNRDHGLEIDPIQEQD